MTYNSNFYINFPQNTFQHPPPTFLPHPPTVPSFIPPMPVPNPSFSDQEFLRHFDKLPLSLPLPCTPKTMSITTAKQKLQKLILVLNNLKNQQKTLSENINTLSDTEWISILEEIEQNKHEINKTMSDVTTCLDTLRKLLAKRSAKRLRLNKLRLERKKKKEDLIKEKEERSRKIDENLQKIKDDINRAKQVNIYILYEDICKDCVAPFLF